MGSHNPHGHDQAISETQNTWSNPVSGVLRSWVADIVLRPWFDEVTLRYVAKVYMPVSRAWAAALEGEGALAAELERSQPSLFRRLSLDRVCRELVAGVDVHALEVTSDQGMVSLAGYVSDEKSKNKALRLASGSDGVQEVESCLEVSPTMSKFMP